MSKFTIYHAFPMESDNFIKVGEVEAVSFEAAFCKSQNLEDEWKEDTRSTSVGDVIESEGVYREVTGIGFAQIEPITEMKLREYLIVDSVINTATDVVKYTTRNKANTLNIGSYGFKTLPGLGGQSTVVKYPNNYEMSVTQIICL